MIDSRIRKKGAQAENEGLKFLALDVQCMHSALKMGKMCNDKSTKLQNFVENTKKNLKYFLHTKILPKGFSTTLLRKSNSENVADFSGFPKLHIFSGF